MAIKSFKEIIENKGYRINPQDRNIFEESDIQSFFGISENDYIEFVIYDANDNQLNQKNYGGVRYIPLTGQNIRDYFLLTEGTLFQKYKFPSEYFIDVNRLIKEAGYNSGIFKTQITLINKRLGSDKEYDKVWIQEISPSRTEIRVLVHKKGVDLFSELGQQYNAFVNDLEFRDDTIRTIFEYIEQINPSVISTYLKSTYSEKWVQKLVQEYNLKDLDLFCTQIYNKFMESTIYEFTNRISDINDINYGKPKGVKNSITLSKNDIRKICERILVNVLHKFMLVPNVSFGSKVNQTIQSMDEVEKIIQTKTSDLQIDTKIPEKKIAVIIKETPPEEVIKEKAIKDVISDVIKDDIIIPKTDILPADEVGVLPKLEPPQEIVVEPKPIGALRGIFRGRGREIDNFQDEGNRRNSFDMIDSVQNRILE
jgi:hypothetical protein